MSKFSFSGESCARRLFVLSAIMLAFLYGFAARGFGLFPNKALEQAWRQMRPLVRSAPPFVTDARPHKKIGAHSIRPERIDEGLTLVSSWWKRDSWTQEIRLIDRDGQVDIVGGSRWFKHRGGTDFEERVIDERMAFTQCAAGQLVKGGRLEVVFSPGDMDGTARWYEWRDGIWKSHDLCHVQHGHSCDIGDVDGDGNMDIFIGEMGSPGAGDDARILIWYGDGRGGFRRTLAWKGQGIHEGTLADLDGDGDLDILLKPYHHNAPRIDVLLNAGE